MPLVGSSPIQPRLPSPSVGQRRLRAAPHQHPGMHGIGALQARRIGSRHRAQIARDIGGGEPDAAQAGNHDVREILAYAAAQRERHRRHGGDRGRADLVSDVGLEPVHQLHRGFEDGPAGGETLAGVIADFRIERHHAAWEQIMRRRHRADVADRERGLANLFPRRRRRRDRARRSIDATRAANLIVSVSCGSSMSTQVRRLPKKSWPSRRCTGSGQDLQRGDVHALAARDGSGSSRNT